MILKPGTDGLASRATRQPLEPGEKRGWLELATVAPKQGRIAANPARRPLNESSESLK
jgi:hypothetical protein